MKTSVFPLIGLVALAFTQCGGSGGDYSDFDMTAESFLHSRKYFAFRSPYGYCVVLPLNTQSWYYDSSVGPDTETNPSSNSVRCNAGVFYTNSSVTSNFIPEDSNVTNITAVYTYNGNGTGTLTLQGTGIGLSKSARVLLGEVVNVTEEESNNGYGSSSTTTESTIRCTVTVYFSGDMSGMFESTGWHNETQGGQTGDFVLYRTSQNIAN